MGRTAAGALGNRLTLASAVLVAEPLTFAAWVRPSALTAAKVLVSIARSDNNDDMFMLYCDNNIASFRKGNASGSGTAAASGLLVTNQWQHVAGTSANAASRACYRGGANKGTDATSIAFGSTINRTGLMHNARMDQDMVLNGSQAESAIWNVVLTDDEILQLSKGIRPLFIRPNNLVGYWPIYGTESPERDFSKNRNAMTVVGTAKGTHPGMYYRQ